MIFNIRFKRSSGSLISHPTFSCQFQVFCHQGIVDKEHISLVNLGHPNRIVGSAFKVFATNRSMMMLITAYGY